MALKDYMPQNVDLVKQKGIHIPLLPEDTIGVWPELHLKEDILGNPVSGRPSLGAIEP